jgi:hypothetical protein
MVADVPQLLVDDVEVVDQPLRGRRDRPFLADLLGEHTVRLEEHPSVVADARRQGVALTRIGGDVLGDRQALGILLEEFYAEQLRPDGLLRLRRRRQRGPFPVDEREHERQSMRREPAQIDEAGCRSRWDLDIAAAAHRRR